MGFLYIVVILAFVALTVSLCIWSFVRLRQGRRLTDANMLVHQEIMQDTKEFEQQTATLNEMQQRHVTSMHLEDSKLAQIAMDIDALHNITAAAFRAMGTLQTEMTYNENTDKPTLSRTANSLYTQLGDVNRMVEDAQAQATRLRHKLHGVEVKTRVQEEEFEIATDTAELTSEMMRLKLAMIEGLMSYLRQLMSSARDVVAHMQQYDIDSILDAQRFARTNFNADFYKKVGELNSLFARSADLTRLQIASDVVQRMGLPAQVEEMGSYTVQKTHVEIGVFDQLHKSVDELLRAIREHLLTLDTLPLLNQLRALLASIPAFGSVMTKLEQLEQRVPENIVLAAVPKLGADIESNAKRLKQFDPVILRPSMKVQAPNSLCISDHCINGATLQALKAQALLRSKPDFVRGSSTTTVHNGEYMDLCTDCYVDSQGILGCYSCRSPEGSSLASQPRTVLGDGTCNVTVASSGELACA